MLKDLDHLIRTYKTQNATNDLESFLITFIYRYKDVNKVTFTELQYFVFGVEGITDEQGINNKINHLINKGILKPVGQDTFEIKNVYTSSLLMKPWNKWFTP